MSLRVTDYRALVAYFERLTTEQVGRATGLVLVETGLDVTPLMADPMNRLPRVLVALMTLSLDPSYPLRGNAHEEVHILAVAYRRLRQLGIDD